MRNLRIIMVGVILAVGLVSIVGRTAAQQSPEPQAPSQPNPQAPSQPQPEAPGSPLHSRSSHRLIRRPRRMLRPSRWSGREHEVLIKLNFQDTPVQTVLEYLSETAGLTIVSDEPIADSRMTVISRQPITLDAGRGSDQLDAEGEEPDHRPHGQDPEGGHARQGARRRISPSARAAIPTRWSPATAS